MKPKLSLPACRVLLYVEQTLLPSYCVQRLMHVRLVVFRNDSRLWC
jgi:hypothetical protein